MKELTSTPAGITSPEADEPEVTSPTRTETPVTTQSARRNPPSVDNLKEARAAAPSAKKPVQDRPPVVPKGSKVSEPPSPTPPMPAKGFIATRVNKLYVRTGKIVKVADAEIGDAIISCTKKESDDDVTVGEAWEDLARTNPRVRALLLKILQGGAWGQLFMAHMPIFMAIVMKDGIRKHIPFMKLMAAMAEPNEDGTPSEMTGGLSEDDLKQAMNTALSGPLGQMMMGMMSQPQNGRATNGSPRTAQSTVVTPGDDAGDRPK